MSASATKQLNNLLFLAFILFSPELRAEECDGLNGKYSGYVTAIGTGGNVELARSNALSALSLRLGSNVSLNETTSSNQTKTTFDSELKVNSALKTDGLEVLDLCSHGNNFHVVLGIPIQLVTERVKSRSKVRLSKVEEWLKSRSYLRGQLTALKGGEEKDRQLWLVMGKSIQSFPAVEEDKWVELNAIDPMVLMITVDDQDQIALETLVSAKRLTHKISFPIVSESLHWRCARDEGVETYGYRRSTTQCQLSDKYQAVISISAESVATTERGNSSAVRAIKQEINKLIHRPGGK